MLFHIAERARWVDALATGRYTASTRNAELYEVGFIHLCTATQVAGVAQRFYRDATDLVLLHIDEVLLDAPVVFEHVGDAPDPFPHLYGPLGIGAVVQVEPFSPPGP